MNKYTYGAADSRECIRAKYINNIGNIGSKEKDRGCSTNSVVRETVPLQTSDMGKKAVSVLAHSFWLP